MDKSISGSLRAATVNQAGASYSKPVDPGKTMMLLIELATPDSYNTYTGYGMVVN